MRRNIWIFNHYATNMYNDKSGRHYLFAKYLLKRGYNPTIFCASTIHNSKKILNTGKEKYITKEVDNIKFVFIKTPLYKGNGKDRLKNMMYFYKNLLSVSKKYPLENGKPDLILASSVHPLTLVAGIKVAKRYSIKCICEIRDLWPESLVAYGILKRESLLAKILYQGERWIYKKADSIIMTWAGGKQYILDQKWDDVVDTNKVHHISNGVDISTFDFNSKHYPINDPDLLNNKYLKIVYTGSIRKVNNLSLLLDVAKIIRKKNRNIRFIIYGDGDERELLEKRCEAENITNVIFKGRVEKKYIASILKSADINILHNTSTSLDKYGQSQNKLFEYLAAGKCIVQTYSTEFSLYTKYKCGVSVSSQNVSTIVATIIDAYENKDKLKIMGENARKAAYNFDFPKLTNKLIDIIEQ